MPFCLGGFAITFMDLSKMEGGFKFFQTVDEFMTWQHDTSLAQSPEWHKENCDICKKHICL